MSTIELTDVKTTDAHVSGLKFITADAQSGSYGTVEGYASDYSSEPDRVGDVIMKGAFGEAEYTVPLLAFHDDTQPIGQCVCTPDAYGLYVKATFANTPKAQEMRELVLAGAIPAFSIGYREKAVQPNDYGGVDIFSVEHYENSLVPIPANPRALVSMAKSFGNVGEPDKITKQLVEAIKAGRRNAANDQEALNAAHDYIVKAGAQCEVIEPADITVDPEPGKSFETEIELIEAELLVQFS